MEASPPMIRMKLLVDTTAGRVLFAEAGNDLVEFLWDLVSLPFGCTARLLLKGGTVVTPLCSLYKSLKDLDDRLFKVDKNLLLYPEVFYSFRSPLLRAMIAAADDDRAVKWKSKMLLEMTTTEEEGEEFEVVEKKDSEMYLVLDTLEVLPMPTDSPLLNQFSMIRDAGVYEEMVVHLGVDEGLRLLEATFETKTTLTDVFLGKETWGLRRSMASLKIDDILSLTLKEVIEKKNLVDQEADKSEEDEDYKNKDDEDHQG